MMTSLKNDKTKLQMIGSHKLNGYILEDFF
jgi:hypothetical protein